METFYKFMDRLGILCDDLMAILIWVGILASMWVVVWLAISGVLYTLGA